MTPKEIIIHCSATPAGENFSASDIDRWHRERGFACIGYHYVILRDGRVQKGREETAIGAHCLGHNATAIGICYIGGCPARSNKDWQKHAIDTRTPEQKSALRKLIADIRARWGKLSVYGHRDFANKPCPGFDAKREYNS